MAKVERLVKLAKLKRSGEPLTVRRMSEECGVSERTVYRYLNTLSGINLEREVRKAPKGSIRDRLRRVGLCQNDQTLIEMILTSSPWFRYPTLARSIRRACRALQLVLEISPAAPTVYRLEGYSKAAPRMRRGTASIALEKFVTAVKSGRTVEIVYRGSRGAVKTLIPQMLVLEEERIGLELFDPAAAKTVLIPLERVRSLGISRSRSSEPG